MPEVGATEIGREQTESYIAIYRKCGVSTELYLDSLKRTYLERWAIESDSLVAKKIEVISQLESTALWNWRRKIGVNNL